MVCQNMWSIHVCEMDAAAERKGVAGCDRGGPNGATAPSGGLVYTNCVKLNFGKSVQNDAQDI